MGYCGSPCKKAHQALQHPDFWETGNRSMAAMAAFQAWKRREVVGLRQILTAFTFNIFIASSYCCSQLNCQQYRFYFTVVILQKVTCMSLGFYNLSLNCWLDIIGDWWQMNRFLALLTMQLSPMCPWTIITTQFLGYSKDNFNSQAR